MAAIPTDAQGGTRGVSNKKPSNGTTRVGNMWSRMSTKSRFDGNDVDFVTIDCKEEPRNQCGVFGRDDESKAVGVLVCRSFFKYSFTVCIDKDDGIDNDICGCCEEPCPESCDTLCSMVEGGEEDGVLISTPSHRGKGNVTECVTRLQSITAQLSKQAECIGGLQ